MPENTAPWKGPCALVAGSAVRHSALDMHAGGSIHVALRQHLVGSDTEVCKRRDCVGRCTVVSVLLHDRRARVKMTSHATVTGLLRTTSPRIPGSDSKKVVFVLTRLPCDVATLCWV